MQTVLIVLCFLLAVTLVVETLYFNLITKRALQNKIICANSYMHSSFSDVGSKLEKLSSKIIKLNDKLDSVADTHDRFVDFVHEDIQPRITALELSKIKKPTKAEKRGRPKKK